MELNKNYYIQTVTADRAGICITVVPVITKLPLSTIKIRRICKYCLENQYWYCNLLVHMERGLIWNFHQVIYFHRHLKYIVQNYCQIDHKERSFYFVWNSCCSVADSELQHEISSVGDMFLFHFSKIIVRHTCWFFHSRKCSDCWLVSWMWCVHLQVKESDHNNTCIMQWSKIHRWHWLYSLLSLGRDGT